MTVVKSGGGRTIESISNKSLKREMHQSHNQGDQEFSREMVVGSRTLKI